VRILFLGNKNRGVVSLDALIERGDNIVGAVTPPESEVENWYPSLYQHANEYDIPTYRPQNINDPDVVDQLTTLEPELIVMAGYSQILDESVLNIPEIGVINLHGGKLPEYRGASTLNWMIIEGEREGGIAVLLAEEEIDMGAILVQEQFSIELDDTIIDVIEKTDNLFPRMLVEAIDTIESGNLEVTSQSREEGAYYHSRRPRDGEIDWERQTARKVYNLTRALDGPYPGAFTKFEGKKLVIEKSSLLDQEVRGVPGRVCLRRPEGVVVIAKDRGLLVETVRPEDGKMVDANAFFSELGADLGK
jgi:methionyl-tRNA formyltransferase